jgi:hypothetical protein
MAEAIRIELDSPADAADLVRALGVRGLTAGIARVNGHCEFEIAYRREKTERLLVDVLAALEAWLADRTYPSTRVRIGQRSYTFGVGSDRERSLPERARADVEFSRRT